jgi:hypothetical protein
MKLNDFFSAPVILSEGGNIFKGDLATTRIDLADVAPTVKWLEKYTGLPLADNMLGTTGRKSSSGDLDLGVDMSSISKDELVNRLTKVAAAMKVDPRDVIKKSGISVHFRTPIAGDPNKGFVQSDFMFTDDLEWTKFALAASGTSSYKGAHRHMVMASISKAMGLKWSPTMGLQTRDTGKLLSKDPDDIAEILLGKGKTSKDLESVETLLAALKDDPQRDEKLLDARETMAKEGIKLPEAAQIAGPGGQLKGTDKAKTVKPRPFAGSQSHPFQGKLVGAESMREDENPTDKITMDIPLFLRMMEYAREDAKTDMDLHDVTERAIALMKSHDYLCMDNYEEIVGSAVESNAFTDARMKAIKAGEKTFKIGDKTYQVTGDTKDEEEAVTEAKKKPKPTNPELWSRAKAAARSKFEVYPSAYANAWAAKWYKGKGGGWRMG